MRVLLDFEGLIQLSAKYLTASIMSPTFFPNKAKLSIPVDLASAILNQATVTVNLDTQARFAVKI